MFKLGTIDNLAETQQFAGTRHSPVPMLALIHRLSPTQKFRWVASAGKAGVNCVRACVSKLIHIINKSRIVILIKPN